MHEQPRCQLLLVVALLFSAADGSAAEASDGPRQISGVYPHLTMRNQGGECGTGAVVPWQGSLWAVTYSPHSPHGSSDKLYQVTSDLKQVIFAGSVGGTPANRMIHDETKQLLIGPYIIDANKRIRVIPPSAMFGRLTGNARHLSDPASKVYYATMEEGLYEVDLHTLDVRCLIRDSAAREPEEVIQSSLPGYHGKGLYSGQGRLVYANNGTNDPRRLDDPTIPSGALAEWFGTGDWQLVRRNQFTEVTGPGGIHGNGDPARDPVWSLGWDARSVILALLENGRWTYYRLPKGSHSYDGAHGWNTEWPRIRDIGEDNLLATMHGTFWRFPAAFSSTNSAGIAPRSNYLKVIGDFCRWNDRVVFGCDDSAASEFLNKRNFKAAEIAPLQSNSNLWFVAPEQIDHFGPVIGRGSVWLRDDVSAETPSDPYLFSGYDYRQLHLSHQSPDAVTVLLQIDRRGNGQWEPLRNLTIPAGQAIEHRFERDEQGAWIRLTTDRDVKGITANFQFRDRDLRSAENSALFDGIATDRDQQRSIGLMRSLAYDRLGLVSQTIGESGKPVSESRYYEITPDFQIKRVESPDTAANLVRSVRQPPAQVSVDEASVLVIEDGKRYRLPRSPEADQLHGKRESAGSAKQLSDFLAKSLARNAKVRVSSTHADYAAPNAVDGRISDDSRWIGRNSGETYIELEFDTPQSIRDVWIATGWQHSSKYVARDFEFQVMQNGHWQTVSGGSVQNNQIVEFEIALAEPVTTQRVRVISETSGFFRVYEIALFDDLIDVDRWDVNDLGPPRLCREVATERDLLNVGGTFYELPSRNAQGVAKIRPVATHNLAVQDFCSHNGLLYITGITPEAAGEHVLRSDDGQAAVWVGVVDELWKLGKPRGIGGPWLQTKVTAGEPSDPYLMTAYDKKVLRLKCDQATTITAQIDVDGTGLWHDWKSWTLKPDETLEEMFPEGFSAYWIRFVSSHAGACTAQLTYE